MTQGIPAQTTRPSPFPNSSCFEMHLYAIHGYICIYLEGTLWPGVISSWTSSGCMAHFLCLNTTRGQQREVS